MANELFWSPLTRSQYEEGRGNRLWPDEIQNGEVLTSPRIADKAAELGFYAVEFLVEIIHVKPIGGIYDVGLYLLDADCHRVDKKSSSVSVDGLIYIPDNPDIEGYFSATTDKYDLGLAALNAAYALS